MDKKQLTEQEIRTRYVTPAIKDEGWTSSQVREEYAITKGRIIALGDKYTLSKGICRLCAFL